MLEIKTSFKNGALIIFLGGELTQKNIKQLDKIVELFKDNGFSNVIIDSKVKCDQVGHLKLKKIKKMNNVLFI